MASTVNKASQRDQTSPLRSGFLAPAVSDYVIAMKKIIIIFLSILSPMSLAVASPKYIEMKGLLKIYGKENPTDELSGFSIFIKGEAAKELYGEITAEPEYNWCLDDGTVTKSVGNFECGMSKKGHYSCSVGLGLEDQGVYRGESC